MGFFSDFKAFALRGNVIDMAVGVVIGASFGKIVNSVVSDLFMPPLGLLLGKVDFRHQFWAFNGKHYPDVDAARLEGPVLTWGNFVQVLTEFVITAFAIYVTVRLVSRFLPKPAPAPIAPSTKACPECCTQVPLAAKRCAACTSPIQ